MQTVDFHFELPPDLIAQVPALHRDKSRLLVLNRTTNQIQHRQFKDVLDYFRSGDVLVMNNSRVIPARLRGRNVKTGGQFEILLLEENSTNDWWAMLRPGKRAQIGTAITLSTPTHHPHQVSAFVREVNAEGHRRLEFRGTPNILDELDAIGEVPLPPYIARENSSEQSQQDRERYQTVYAAPAGSVAAPTAGLHFTEALLAEIRSRGVEVHFVTLHVGPGTFAPVKATELSGHKMHAEKFEVSDATARAINAAKTEKRRVIAVGTTSVRVLESAAAQSGGVLRSGRGRTDIFIYPPRDFRMVDALLTNFHLPCSTLLMLVSAFVTPGKIDGREITLSAYREAVRERYRFFSYGDAMLLL
ncbi:MAG: tRNA preQ1(34) S-adenosylmethionine ribosyltransferase-isomerase QueA [Verrucomicrobiota bacterium]